jgi:Helix-turn-helix domain
MRGEQLGSENPVSQKSFELLTVEELAERLRVPASWIREQTRSRSLQGDPLPHLRLGRYIRFQWGSAELEGWLRRRLCLKTFHTSAPIC